MTYFSISDDLWTKRHGQIHKPSQFQTGRCVHRQCIRDASAVQEQAQDFQHGRLYGYRRSYQKGTGKVHRD